jgi:PEP-CTERM motif
VTKICWSLTKLGAMRAVGALLLVVGSVTQASAALIQRASVLATTEFFGILCDAPAGGCTSFEGTFGLVSDLRAALTSVALAPVDGESKPDKHDVVLELLLGESLGFYFKGKGTAPPPPGGPVPIPYPNVFAFVAGTSLIDLLPPAADAPEVLIGRIQSRMFEPFNVSGLLVGFDGSGDATQVGTWSVRLEPAAIPEPGTALLLLAGIAVASSLRRRPRSDRAMRVPELA